MYSECIHKSSCQVRSLRSEMGKSTRRLRILKQPNITEFTQVHTYHTGPGVFTNEGVPKHLGQFAHPKWDVLTVLTQRPDAFLRNQARREQFIALTFWNGFFVLVRIVNKQQQLQQILKGQLTPKWIIIIYSLAYHFKLIK